MQELEATIGRTLSVLWLILWRSLLGGFVLGAALGAVLGFIIGLAGGTANQVALVTGPIGALAGLAWFAFVIRMALRKNYREFRIALLPRAGM